MTTRTFGRVMSSNLVTFAIALVLASPVLWWASDRRSPVVIHAIDLIPPEVRAGQKILRRVDVTRSRSCLTDVFIVIVDADRVRWVVDEPALDTPGPVGERDVYNVPMIIPPGAAPGPAEMRITTKRVCNPLQKIWPLVAVTPPVRFTILPP